MANTLYLGNIPLIDLSGYALSSNVYTKGEVDNAISNVDVSDQLQNYVEKDGDKVLSTNDFTNELKAKLEGLANFDPTSINSAIDALEATLGDITGDGKDITAALDTWNEIKAFVADYENTDSIASLLSTLESTIHTWVENKNYLTSVPSDYKTKTENDALYQPKGDYLTQSAISDMETKTNADATYAKKTDVSDMLTKTEASTTYQPLGSYAPALNNISGDGSVLKVVALSESEYAALQTKDATCLYIVK